MILLHRLRELREARNLSQADIAKALNISRQSYNFYENDKRDPDTQTLKALADFFNVTIDYLLGRDEFERVKNKKNPLDRKEKLLYKIISADPDTIAEVEQYLDYLETKKKIK